MGSFSWDSVRSPLILTLQVTLVSTVFATLVGILFAYQMSRARFIGKALLDAVFTLPMVLPPTVLGYYLLVLFGKKGILGSFLLEHFHYSILFNLHGAILASAIVSFPLVYRSAKASFEDLDPEYEEASYTLGKSKWATFLLVILPLSWRGILAGSMMAYARGMGEFGATLMVAGNIPERTQTIALAIYDSVQAGNDTFSLLLVIVASITCILVLTLAGTLLKKPHW
ncbi:molybdate ABC transporter permease subunit [Leptospira langatensis]|uniref:Molybdenum transport system permease n=1 Tax=Leptospira langatensis TaxID=2484983 RepID=A0A5F1ZQT5_9LEPT|nr:molybdate ABC transporter permease subunit [Leptospira langatensis]TGK02638.1 molybdate ABC transporter permease subunit [Leptospira langatensis]TGL40160.1 molybdate ABC transporter permease subunit [Leptospira langatensis]